MVISVDDHLHGDEDEDDGEGGDGGDDVIIVFWIVQKATWSLDTLCSHWMSVMMMAMMRFTFVNFCYCYTVCIIVVQTCICKMLLYQSHAWHDHIVMVMFLQLKEKQNLILPTMVTVPKTMRRTSRSIVKWREYPSLNRERWTGWWCCWWGWWDWWCCWWGSWDWWWWTEHYDYHCGDGDQAAKLRFWANDDFNALAVMRRSERKIV